MFLAMSNLSTTPFLRASNHLAYLFPISPVPFLTSLGFPFSSVATSSRVEFSPEFAAGTHHSTPSTGGHGLSIRHCLATFTMVRRVCSSGQHEDQPMTTSSLTGCYKIAIQVQFTLVSSEISFRLLVYTVLFRCSIFLTPRRIAHFLYVPLFRLIILIFVQYLFVGT